MQHESYRYQPLEEPSHIRLLRIAPRQDNDELYLELEHVSIDDVDDQYEAVSYRWGSQAAVHHAVIDGNSLALRANIWNCLRHLRKYKLTTSRLWVDSICINQEDDLEKTQQVFKMEQIFSKASKVLVWLGSTSMLTCLLPPGVDHFAYSILDMPTKSWFGWNFKERVFDEAPYLRDQIMSIVYNSYWTRLWIVQEVLLSRRVDIVVGKNLIHESWFRSIFCAATTRRNATFSSQWVAGQRSSNMAVSASAPTLEHLMNQIEPSPVDHVLATGKLPERPASRPKSRRYGDDGSRVCTLAGLLKTYRRQCCSDPRDYVFGLIGLVGHRLDSGISRPQIGYTSPQEEVLIESIRYMEEEMLYIYTTALELEHLLILCNILTVTDLSYRAYEEQLTLEELTVMQMKSFNLRFGFFRILTADHGTRKLDDISAGLQYEGERSAFLMVELLSGGIRTFAYRASNQSKRLADDPRTVMECHFLGARVNERMLVCRDPDEGGRIRITHFLRTDTLRLREGLPMTELQAPNIVQDAIEREINALGLDWDNLPVEIGDTSIRLSVKEIISLCEWTILEVTE